MQVDSQARAQHLKGLAPGARYEVMVVSVRGFEESEPLTGFFTTGEIIGRARMAEGGHEAMGGGWFSVWRGEGVRGSSRRPEAQQGLGRRGRESSRGLL